MINIQIPKFSEVNLLIDKEDNGRDDQDTSDEDISDSAYLKYHDQFEKRERDYRMSIFQGEKKKEKIVRNNLDTTRTDSSECNFKFRIELDSIKDMTDRISNSDYLVREFVV